MSDCKACLGRSKKGLEGQCPSCANERTRNALREERSIGDFSPVAGEKGSIIRSRIIRQQQRIVDMGEQIGAMMLLLETEEDFMAELLVLEKKEFQERNLREEREAVHREAEEREAEEHELRMLDRANARVDYDP